MITEKFETKIVKECDVLVCGGGFGGISAALSAARHGSKVILLEKEYMLGGLGTSGLITIYLPLCDGFGRQISFGIAEELLKLSISMGAECRYPANWLDSNDPSKRTNKDPRYEVRYNAQLFAILAEQLLLKEGVEILYGTYAVATQKIADKINAVITESKSGREAIKVKSVVDATGDCDVAKFCGAPTTENKAGNSLAAWYYFYGQSGYDLKVLGFLDVPEEGKREDKAQISGDKNFIALTNTELSEMTILAHSSILNDLKRERKQDPNLMPTTIATIPQVRMTRKLVGEYELGEEEMHTYFDDSIGMVSSWKKRGPAWEVPFSTLYSKSVKNLIVAGRCTSVTDQMWDIMRVIPCCAVTGQAAGTAAAMTDDFSTIDIAKLQQALKDDGVILHEKDL